MAPLAVWLVALRGRSPGRRVAGRVALRVGLVCWAGGSPCLGAEIEGLPAVSTASTCVPPPPDIVSSVFDGLVTAGSNFPTPGDTL